MKLPTLVRALLRDSWPASIRNLQSWVDSVQNILAHQVQFGAQIGYVVTCDFVAGTPQTVAVPVKPDWVMVLTCKPEDSASDVLSFPAVIWTVAPRTGNAPASTGPSIIIRSIFGLEDPGKKFTLTLAIGERP